jgi:hypothetical protein
VDDQKELSGVYSQIIEKLGYASPPIFNDGTSIVKALIRDRSFLTSSLWITKRPKWMESGPPKNHPEI